jgi:hypothetical protein
VSDLPGPLRRLLAALILGLPLALALGPFPTLRALTLLGLVGLVGLLLIVPAAGLAEELAWSVLFGLLSPIAWLMPHPGPWWTALARRSEDTRLILGALERGEAWGDDEATFEMALNRLSSGVPGLQQGGLLRLQALAARGHGEAQRALAGCLAWGLGTSLDPTGARALWARLGENPEAEIPLPRPGLLRQVAAREERGLEGNLGKGLARAGEATQHLLSRSALARAGLWIGAVGLGGFLLALPLSMILSTFLGPLGPALIAFSVPLVAIFLWMAFSLRRSNRFVSAHRKLLRRASGGDPEACFRLGEAFDRGLHQMPKDPTEARRWFRAAAEQGHAESAFRLGELLLLGLGGLKDRPAALAWFRRAAEQGHAGAGQRLAEAQPAPEASEDA